MVRRTREALEDENGADVNTSIALTRYRVRPESRRAKRARLRTVQESEACCSCTRFSTCATNNCECVQAHRDCGDCLCRRNCSNQPGWQNNPEDNGNICRGVNLAEEDTTSTRPSDNPPTEMPIPSIPLHHRTPLTGTTTVIPEGPQEAPTDETPVVDFEEEILLLQTQPEPEEERPTMNVGRRKLTEVYGDYVRQNDGTTQDGGVTEDVDWQERWRKVVGLPPQRYNVPNGKIGGLFVKTVAEELQGVTERRWNSERFIVFQSVILQRSREVKKAKDIRRRIEGRLRDWREKKYDMLVQDTVRTSLSLIQDIKGGMTEEQIGKRFTKMVLEGKIRQAVRFVTERGQGGALSADDRVKGKDGTESTVLEVLLSKHPDSVEPEDEVFEEYPVTPEMVSLDITGDTVTKVATRLSGAAGPGGVDSMALQQWLLRFGKNSNLLREAVAQFTRWMANSYPPWAAYRAIMANRLIALDKCPGVRPVGVGEIWRRLFAKTVLILAVGEAKEICGADQLCAGLEAGIEGGIHAAREAWKENEDDEEWGFLLVDAKNAFNEGNRIAFLWTIRHLWPSGARFVFNCYKHWSLLIMRGEDGDITMLHSKEGVTQGDPLAMVVYGVGMLPLTHILRRQTEEMMQLWYADDAAAGGKFDKVLCYFNTLTREGPKRGYFPEPTKSILCVKPQSVVRATALFQHLGFKIVTGTRYLGGHIGTEDECDQWVKKKVAGWADGVKALSKVARTSPQCAFAGLQKSLQSEWMHLQRATGGIGPLFAPVEAAISQFFLPALLGIDPTQGTPPPLRQLLSLPVKCAGVGLPIPPDASDTHNATSMACTTILTNSLLSKRRFNLQSHISTMKAERLLARANNVATATATLSTLSTDMPPLRRRKVERNRETGAWLSIIPTVVNGLSLSKEEFRDGLRMRYGIGMDDLPTKCDGCGAKFTIAHALACKKGGLVVGRHDELKDELANLAILATSPNRVRDEPKINIGRDTEGNGVPACANIDSSTPNPYSNDKQFERGDILVHGLYDRSTSCIIDVRVTDTDQPSYLSSTPAKIILKQEREKKKRYLESCLEQRRHFAPYVVDTYGLLGEEAKAFNKRIASKLADKWQSPYSATMGFVNARVSVAIVRATHLCIRGSRVPYRHVSTKGSQWEDGAGLGLLQTTS